ncbi:hypothetical protein L1987_42689 [Smallanthus sonchifolius]|uniref:Uncharacterized protein n=1 Tax=Smallanthus sonchifolius TaxID=185202 RepID=A0ACB9GKP7_9ASTR|nr:hypothetical protein L1987_42689 [Smallanthus sonchifolius]
MERDCIPRLRLRILGVLACFAISNALRSDIECLRSIKESLEDYGSVLSTWDFNNNTEGFICNFIGVGCWHDYESKVLTISLPNAKLRGPFPIGIRNCTSMQHLDLSGNYLLGSIPFNLAYDLPYLVSLDLSNNNLSGPIPPSIANLRFINVLRLDNNHLTGQIPIELSALDRIKELGVANNSLSGQVPPSIAKCRSMKVLRLDNNRLSGQIPLELSQLDHIIEFSVANNRLSGRVPTFPFGNLTAESYANNLGLCGGPLSRCKNEHHEDLFFSGFVVGLSVSTILRDKVSPHSTKIPNHICRENINEESKIVSTEKYICRLSLVELEMATNDFDNKKVIGYGNMGLMYKAKFLNGLILAVKRLHKFESFEKEFLLEIEILGRLRHTNFVPLLGFCFELEKKFLVYKYMSNGTLHQWLHSMPQMENRKMGWTLRLRIAVGIARGLAWLHHNNVLRVAHRKISSNCILLDDKFEPKISNFGDSNILMNTSGTPSSACNFVVPLSSHDPYKEDVYSFGILLLELVSGRERPYACINSPSDNVCDLEFNVIDECLMGQGFNEEIYETLRIAENCIQTHKDGAASMLQVYQAIRVVGKSRNENSVNSCMDVDE